MRSAWVMQFGTGADGVSGDLLASQRTGGGVCRVHHMAMDENLGCPTSRSSLRCLCDQTPARLPFMM